MTVMGLAGMVGWCGLAMGWGKGGDKADGGVSRHACMRGCAFGGGLKRHVTSENYYYIYHVYYVYSSF